MKTFIIQFKKAKARGMRLIYDGVENRYMVTHSPNWQNWAKHTLIKNFKS